MKGDKGDKGDPGPQGPTGPAGTGALGEETSSFAGFTTATTTGAVTNGRIGMHAMCATAFPGSHLCHDLEYTLSTSTVTPPADGAWIDSSHAGGVAAVRNATAGGTSCDSWTQTASGYYGVYITAAGGMSNTDCSRRKAVACCNSPARTRVAGFTRATTSGAAGGRMKMHAMCATEFAGSHLCHYVEYARAHSAEQPPASGAWLDDSLGTTAAAARSLNNVSCESWTQSASGYYGVYLTANGGTSSTDCSRVKSVACCR